MSNEPKHECEMRFLMPSNREFELASEVHALGFEAGYPNEAPESKYLSGVRWRLWSAAAAGFLFAWTLLISKSLALQTPEVAGLAIEFLFGWLTILSILLAVRPMQSAEERACLSLVLRRYGFGAVALMFLLAWVAASRPASVASSDSSAELGLFQRGIAALPVCLLFAGICAAAMMFMSLVVEAGATYRFLARSEFFRRASARERRRWPSLRGKTDARVDAVVSGLVTSLERAVREDEIDDVRQAIQLLTPVMRVLVWKTPVKQLGWDFSANNLRSGTREQFDGTAGAPVVVDLRLETLISGVAARSEFPVVPSLLHDLRHIWLSATFAAMRLGRPGIVSGSCRVAFSAYRDSHPAVRQGVVKNFVDAATEFMLVLRSQKTDKAHASLDACRRPVVSLFLHLSRLSAEREEWDNFEHFARQLAHGCGNRRGDCVSDQHRDFCGLALCDLTGWLATEEVRSAVECARGFQLIESLLERELAAVNLLAVAARAQENSTEWDLGTEYWGTPELERPGRFGEVTGGCLNEAIRLQGIAVLLSLHHFGDHAGVASDSQISAHLASAQALLVRLGLRPG